MKSLAIILLATVALGIGWRFWSLSAQHEAKARDKKGKPPVPVTLAPAQVRDVPLLLRAVGRAEAPESVILKPRIDGQVVGVDFTEGQRVTAGQVLLRLDTADMQARLRQAEANLARDQAQLAKARADVTRYAALKAQGFVSDEKLAETRALADAAEAVARADQAALDLARLQLGYATPRAPFAGVVGAARVHPGAAVKMNDTELVLLNRVQPIHVSFAVPEKHLARLRQRLASGPIPVAAREPGGAGPGHTGQARFMDNAVDTTTGTIRLKAVLPNRDEALTPGQFLEVSLTLDTLRDAVTVPAEALQQGPEGSFVFVVGDDLTARPRPVTLATLEGGMAALTQGLQAGERVVVDGQSRLTPGAKVKLAAAKGNAAAAVK